MTAGSPAPQTASQRAIPIFPIPPLSPLAIGALESADLVRFYERNHGEFAMLVCVFYAKFLESTEQLRQKSPSPEKLFRLFCAEIQTMLTAASPQAASFQVERRPSEVNGLAFEVLWNHLRRQGLTTWQDFYGDGRRRPPKVIGLVSDFVHFIVARGFENGARTCVSDASKLTHAQGIIRDINRGARQMKKL